MTAGAKTSRARLWVGPALLVAVWLLFGGPLTSFAGKLAEVQKNDNASYLPISAESTTVNALARRFHGKRVIPAVVVYEREAGITKVDLASVAADVTAIQGMPRLAGTVSPPIPSADGKAIQVIVPLDSDAGLELRHTVDQIRERAASHAGLTAHVTGPGGVLADLSEAFEQIDGLLLTSTLIIVFIILVVVYRSPMLPFIVLGTAGLALGAASAVVYVLTDHGWITLNGQSQGILFILVIGACTDYSLLLVARFREELRRHESRFEALRVARRAAVEPILASGGTVILGVLCMLFSDLNSNKSLGPVAALGIAASLLAALTLLPAVLALLGRAAFWPFRPEFGTDAGEHRGAWARVAALVGRRPRLVWAVTAFVLVVFAAFGPQFSSAGVSQTEAFLTPVDSVVGQDVLGRHFPAGIGSPAVIVTKVEAADAVSAAAQRIDGIEWVVPTPATPPKPGEGLPLPGEPLPPPKIVDGLVQLNATFAAPPYSDDAVRTLQQLRDAVHAVPGADAKVGGSTAIHADIQETSRRDRSVIIPLVLAVILLILIVLLRALVAPVLLIATVVLSFAATLGVAALLFNHVFDFPGSDPALPLFSFIFLVALGIDYNIFLMTRVREESAKSGTRTGTLTGLRVTGGVITSAGVVLAATFAALAVLPLLFLAQIAFIVAFGVLLDTFVVRSLLVPAATIDIGRWSWWPSRLSRGDP
jgi:RND superfamily putative drug exporter